MKINPKKTLFLKFFLFVFALPIFCFPVDDICIGLLGEDSFNKMNLVNSLNRVLKEERPEINITVINIPEYAESSRLSFEFSRMKGIILLISAENGLRPQTRDQLLLASKENIHKLIAIMTNAQYIKDKALMNITETEIRNNLTMLGIYGKNLPFLLYNPNNLNDLTILLNIINTKFTK